MKHKLSHTSYIYIRFIHTVGWKKPTSNFYLNISLNSSCRFSISNYIQIIQKYHINVKKWMRPMLIAVCFVTQTIDCLGLHNIKNLDIHIFNEDSFEWISQTSIIMI